MITNLWEFTHPGAVTAGVAIAVLATVLMLEVIAAWSITHREAK